ncbi:MAG: 30S ribosomal protein S20 [Candidatus Levybacteria bacterium]|nr:30S ribosomal protein S20 [Candidatus Levybacteria bacterium]
MPVIKSAKKKLRQDRKRKQRNDAFYSHVKKLLKQARKSRSKESARKATQAVDKAAKRGLLHKNKAARIKSSLVKK